MRKVILESPYAGDVEAHIKYAQQAVRDCLERDEAPIASHLLFTQPGILDDNDPGERALGIRAGLSWLSVAQCMVVYTDYGISRGMTAAIDEALLFNLPIEYRSLI